VGATTLRPPLRPPRRRGSAGSWGEATGDPTLETVLDEIETRAAVELAKLEFLGRPS